MRIGILTPYYPPEMGAPPARLHEIATRLVAAGDEVTVITAYPSRPLGRIYPGYGGKLSQTSMEDGIRVIRTWIKPSAASATFLGRAINDLTFTWSSGWGVSDIGRLDVSILSARIEGERPSAALRQACMLARKQLRTLGPSTCAAVR